MEDRYRFLTNFSSQIAEIELFGEFLIPKVRVYFLLLMTLALRL